MNPIYAIHPTFINTRIPPLAFLALASASFAAEIQVSPDRDSFAKNNPTREGVPVEAFQFDPELAQDLQIEVWATTPQIYSPVAMDVDAQGRVWATEGINFKEVLQATHSLRKEQEEEARLYQQTGEQKQRLQRAEQVERQTRAKLQELERSDLAKEDPSKVLFCFPSFFANWLTFCWSSFCHDFDKKSKRITRHFSF